MNEGILQQMVSAGSNNWFTTNGSSQHHPLLAATPQNHAPHHSAPPLTAPLSWTASHELPRSWSQLVLGFAGEEDKAGISHIQPKNMENWEQQLLDNSSISCGGAKQENLAASYSYGARNLEFTTAKSTNCLSYPKSCVTTSSMCTDMFGFSNKSSVCNSGAAKKSKRNPTTSVQSGIKVRKEKLGDRITALHQLVSPFGKRRLQEKYGSGSLFEMRCIQVLSPKIREKMRTSKRYS